MSTAIPEYIGGTFFYSRHLPLRWTGRGLGCGDLPIRTELVLSWLRKMHREKVYWGRLWRTNNPYTRKDIVEIRYLDKTLTTVKAIALNGSSGWTVIS